MKKEYTKPNMEIVSFKLEENITEGTSIVMNTGYQTVFEKLDY